MKIRKNFPPAFCCLLITAFLFVLSGCFTGKVGTTAPAELSELQQELTNKTWLLSGMFFENQFIPLEPGHGSNHILLFYEDGTFESSTQAIFRELYDSLVYGIEGQRPDVYYVLADFDAYVEAHEKILEAYADKRKWAKMALLNVARAGKFSSDRTIEEYVNDIWKLKKVSL